MSAFILRQALALGNIALAMILGALIGWERETAEKPAGLRTNMLVAGASALLVALGELVISTFANRYNSQVISSDPIRIIAAVITGVSFLGAGTIIRQRSGERVEGLTTAASLLFSSGVGITVALGDDLLAIGSTVLVLITLRVVPWIESHLQQSEKSG